MNDESYKDMHLRRRWDVHVHLFTGRYHVAGVIAFSIHEAAVLGKSAGPLADWVFAALNSVWCVRLAVCCSPRMGVGVCVCGDQPKRIRVQVPRVQH